MKCFELAAVFQASERACWLKSSDGPLIASGDDDTTVLTLPQTVTEVRTIDDISSVDALLQHPRQHLPLMPSAEDAAAEARKSRPPTAAWEFQRKRLQLAVTDTVGLTEEHITTTYLSEQQQEHSS